MTIGISPLPQPEHLTHPKYRPDIDGLRAIAVLSVVIYHAFPKFIKAGFIGVDIFFVISGFLISTIIMGSLEQNRFSFIEFYSRRIKRIFPALLLVLIAIFVLGWFALLADEYKQLGKHIAGGAGFISNFLFWNESGYFDNAAETKPLLHLWSLGIEEQFYIVWPLLLWLTWKKRFNLLTITIVVAVISFALNIGKVHSDAVATFYSPQTRFWELLVGSILAYMTRHRRSIFPTKFKHKLDIWLGQIIYAQAPENNGKTLHNVQSLLGAVLILTGLLVITNERHFPGWWALLPTIGAVLIISAGVHSWFNRVVLSNRVLVWFGLISFPLYLWHWPLLSFARIIESETPSNQIRIAAVLISIALAWLTYKFIEKPIRFGKHGKTKTITLLFIMVCIGCVGYYTYNKDGLRFRKKVSSSSSFITELSAMTETWQFFDAGNAYRVGVCHMVPIIDKRLEMQNCIDRNRPLIFIWGDSYAASLYPGLLKLKTLSKNAFGIAQFTNGNAPPFFDANKKTSDINNLQQNLLEVNNEKLEIIKEIKPSLVILTWMYSGLNGLDMNQSIVAINSAIMKINEASINTKVMVIGPFPHWNGTLKDQIIKYSSNHNGHLPPSYTNYGLSDEPKKWDIFFKDEFKKLGVNYISSQDFLCDSKGCLTRTGDNPQDLTAVDWGHLTPKGSEFLINKISNQILKELRPIVFQINNFQAPWRN